MVQKFRVANWVHYQHYKDRNPPWIKLHNQLLDNYDFSCLQDASKAHLLSIWMLASRTNNEMPSDPKWVASKIGATEEVDLEALLDSGFLELIPEKQQLNGLVQDASKTLPEGLQDACLETEAETEREKKGASPPKRFSKPSIQDVSDYMRDHHNRPDYELESRKFVNYYESCGWKIGKSGKPMKSWPHAVGTWVTNLPKPKPSDARPLYAHEADI